MAVAKENKYSLWLHQTTPLFMFDEFIYIIDIYMI